MTEEKKTRLMVAFAVNAILLLTILFGTIVYQFVQIGVLNNRRTRIAKEIQQITQTMEDDQDLIEQLQSEEYYEYYCLRHPDIVKAYLESRNGK